MPLGVKHGRCPVFLSAEVDEIGLVPYYVPYYWPNGKPNKVNSVCPPMKRPPGGMKKNGR